ncbi:MAG: DUF2889 domain-containing protein [Rhodospirillales bacterium]|nr:DUF2889 domain-containing protein [Rhodospirillales bacterium]
MPLTKPAARKLMHTREICCCGFERDDGLWDIEGRIVDTKTYSFANEDRGGVASGEAIHDMHVRLTLDDELVVHHAEASTDASPFTMCPDITGGVAALKGERVVAGWTNAVHRKLGRTMGCTHIVQLLVGPLATTAYQTISPIANRRKTKTKEDVPTKPRILNTCHAYGADSPVVKRLWPDHYTGNE